MEPTETAEPRSPGSGEWQELRGHVRHQAVEVVRLIAILVQDAVILLAGFLAEFAYEHWLHSEHPFFQYAISISSAVFLLLYVVTVTVHVVHYVRGQLGTTPAGRVGEFLLTRLPGRERLAWTVAAVALVAAAALTIPAVRRAREVAPDAPVTRFSLTLPPDQEFTGTLGRMVALSPDGSRLAYVANNQLYTRRMSEGVVRPIAGTDAGRVRSVLDFAWSPDDQFMAYVNDGALEKIPLNGGATTTICPVTTATSLHWGVTGILFVAPGGIMRVSPDGGTPERIAAVADESEEVRDPQMLPDGHTVLFSVAKLADDITSRWEKADIVVQTIPSGVRRTVVHGGSEVRYVPTGHLVYAANGTLMAVAFDASRQQVIAAPVGMLEGVRRGLSGDVAQFSVSDTGTLAYVPGPAGSAAARRNRLVSVNMIGGATPLQTPEGAYQFPRFSPDGTRLTFDTDDGKDANVWVYELSGASAMRRLTFGGRNRHPIWSRDGQWITFQSDREGDLALFRQRVDGTAVERLTKAAQGTAHVPQSWSADGGHLLFTENKGGVLGAWTGAQNPGSSSVLMLLSSEGSQRRAVCRCSDARPRGQCRVLARWRVGRVQLRG